MPSPLCIQRIDFIIISIIENHNTNYEGKIKNIFEL